MISINITISRKEMAKLIEVGHVVLANFERDAHITLMLDNNLTRILDQSEKKKGKKP